VSVVDLAKKLKPERTGCAVESIPATTGYHPPTQQMITRPDSGSPGNSPTSSPPTPIGRARPSSSTSP
jgi:hypothetical protein